MTRSLLFAAALAALAPAALPTVAAAQPAGSYQQSCRVLSTSGGQITARCNNGRGDERTSTINASACRGDIGNNAGLLQCNGATATEVRGRDDDRGGGGRGGYDRGGDDRGSGYGRDTYDRGGGYGRSAPTGSYQRSCRDIRYSGSQLTARCNDGRGEWRSTTLNTGACRGDIGNLYGRLNCNGASGTLERDRGRNDDRGYDRGNGYDRGGYDRNSSDYRYPQTDDRYRDRPR